MDQLNARYTEERYLRKRELSKALGMSLVDDYWATILNYRSRFKMELPIRDARGQRFYITMCEGVKAKLKAFDSLAVRIGNLASSFNNDEEGRVELRKRSYLSMLSNVSLINRAGMNELSVKALINGTYQEKEPKHQSVIDYMRALDSLISKEDIPFERDALGIAYQEAMGEEELSSFYRDIELDANAARNIYVSNLSINALPSGMIDDRMNDLETFLDDENLDASLKALVSMFYVDYVKPFASKNSESALLMAKILFANGTGKGCYYLPLEGWLIPTTDSMVTSRDVQSTLDLTYYLIDAVAFLSKALKEMENLIKDIKIKPFEVEAKQLSEEEKREAEDAGLFNEGEQSSIFDEVGTEEKPVVEIKPVIEERPIAQPIRPVVKEEKKETVKRISPEQYGAAMGGGELSIEVEKSSLSNKEVREYGKYLLQSDPLLNKNQAYFLARNCTIGRYYTIQDFKHFAKCAYETARTSMDKLADLGYYEKLQVKNKFVYTPKKKEIK